MGPGNVAVPHTFDLKIAKIYLSLSKVVYFFRTKRGKCSRMILSGCYILTTYTDHSNIFKYRPDHSNLF